jgi:hypothetical protein
MTREEPQPGRKNKAPLNPQPDLKTCVNGYLLQDITIGLQADPIFVQDVASWLQDTLRRFSIQQKGYSFHSAAW